MLLRMKTIALIFSVVLLISVMLIACEADEPTGTPAPTTVPPATPTSVPTAVPTIAPTSAPTPSISLPGPIATPSGAATLGVEGDGRDPADYSDDELLVIAQALADEFFAAIQEEPEPNLEQAKATYSSHCQPEDDEAFAAQIEGLLGLMEGGFSVELVAVERESDNAALTLSFATIGGSLVRNEPSLMIFEDGRWVDNDCEAGRAAFYGTGDSGAGETTESNILDLPTVPDVPLPELGDDPADHTDEEIALSAEAIINSMLRAMFAQPEPNLAGMRSSFVPECQTVTDNVLTELAAGFKDAFDGQAETIEYNVDSVERIDDDQAWVTTIISADGIPVVETEPSLHAFEDGQWRHVECIDT